MILFIASWLLFCIFPQTVIALPSYIATAIFISFSVLKAIASKRKLITITFKIERATTIAKAIVARSITIEKLVTQEKEQIPKLKQRRILK